MSTDMRTLGTGIMVGGGTTASDSDPCTVRVPVWIRLDVVVAVALVLRLVVAWRSERIAFADELFQYLEQAHRLVYGYGFIPWEYRFGARNWLLPGTLASVLEALRLSGWDRPTVYIPALKSVLAIASLSVVYACYVIGRNLFCERTGRIAAVFTALWYQLVFSSTQATPEVLATYTIITAFAALTAHLNARRVVAVGLLLGTGLALRIQYAPCILALWILSAIGWGWRPTLALATVTAATFGLAGALDLLSWGAPFISYYNSILFNMIYGVSGNVFGAQFFLYYFYYLTVASLGLHVISISYGSIAWRRCWPVLLILACLLVPHSLIPHKEPRFVFLAIPLLLVLLADAVRTPHHRCAPIWNDQSQLLPSPLCC